MSSRPSRSSPADDGIDFDWLLTSGAESLWHHCFRVQSYLTDIDAVCATGDWPVCVAICADALRAVAECEYLAAGLRPGSPDSEIILRIALDAGPTATALRQLPPAAEATRPQAERAIEVVREREAAFRALLPVRIPMLRSAAGSPETMRLSGSMLKWRQERGLAADPKGRVR